MASRAAEHGPSGFSFASITTASLGKGPGGREAARAAAAKNDSLKAPEASAAELPIPIWRNDLREYPLRLPRKSLCMVWLRSLSEASLSQTKTSSECSTRRKPQVPHWELLPATCSLAAYCRLICLPARPKALLKGNWPLPGVPRKRKNGMEIRSDGRTVALDFAFFFSSLLSRGLFPAQSRRFPAPGDER